MPSILLLASSIAGASSSGDLPPWPEPLQPIFEASAARHNVPVELLETLGFFGSGFENRGDAPTIEGGYGVMALRQNDQGGDSLALGATLTGVPEATLKVDPAANIEAAAAVLDYYARMWQIDRSKGIEAWLQPIINYAGLDEENSKFFAWEVMKRLQSGTDQVNAAGERFAVPAQSIGSVDLPSLFPKGVTTSLDYSGAVWYPAASCNYSTSSNIDDTVIIHTMEGTLAGTASWFRNCSAQVSSQYGIGSDGTIYQFVAENQQAWHVSCYNYRAIGLEHEGYASMSTFPTAEYVASAALVRDICNRRGIPKQKTTVGPGIMGHIDVTNCCCGTHTDPGNGWNWTYYINQVNANSTPSTYDFNWTGARTSEHHNANARMNQTLCGEVVDCLYPFNSDGSRTAEQWLKWQANSNLTGRGWFHTDVIIPCNYGVCKPLFRMLKSDGADKGPTSAVDECPISGWTMLYDGYTDMSTGGWRTDTLDWARCAYNSVISAPPAYGSDPGGAGRMRMYGDQWKYIDDWTCAGPFSTVNTINDNPAGFDEANLYLYPAVDTTHGNVLGFGGKTPGRVTTGDAGDGTSYLNYQSTYPAYSGTYCATYAAAWIHVPTTASPKFAIGSDDGCKLWVDQNNFWTNDASRAFAYDADVTSNIGISQSATGWHRVLFKIRNGTGGFGGAVSLRNGGDFRWNERSVDLQDMGGYKSYGVGYEQDGWYPTIAVSSFYGASNPANASSLYGNNTTVFASGTAAGQGPVPLWKEMHFEWGWGLSGDTNYTDVGFPGASWSNATTGVTGHRRFHFFSVSQSHRTSFQDSGRTGGWNFTGGGRGTYFDVFIDNVPPLDPTFATVTAAGTNSIRSLLEPSSRPGYRHRPRRDRGLQRDLRRRQPLPQRRRWRADTAQRLCARRLAGRCIAYRHGPDRQYRIHIHSRSQGQQQRPSRRLEQHDRLRREHDPMDAVGAAEHFQRHLRPTRRRASVVVCLHVYCDGRVRRGHARPLPLRLGQDPDAHVYGLRVFLEQRPAHADRDFAGQLVSALAEHQRRGRGQRHARSRPVLLHRRADRPDYRPGVRPGRWPGPVAGEQARHGGAAGRVLDRGERTGRWQWKCSPRRRSRPGIW